MSWKMIKEGDRVQVNAFSHKGKKGTVMFKGEVEGKKGEMLGLDMDETETPDGEEPELIYFRSAQVKLLPADDKPRGSTLKKPEGGLKKPAGGGLKKPAGLKKPTEASKEEDTPQEERKSVRGSTKLGGLKGPTRASAIKKPTAGEEAKANKISKIKAGSRIGGAKPGMKKPGEGLKKPEGAKTLAQKKEDMKNKVKARRAGAAGLKGKEESKKPAVKKFARPAAGNKLAKPTKASETSKEGADAEEATKLAGSSSKAKIGGLKKTGVGAKSGIGGAKTGIGGAKTGIGGAKSGIGGTKSGIGAGKGKLAGLKKPAGASKAGGLAKPGGSSKVGGLAKPGATSKMGGLKKPAPKPKEDTKRTEPVKKVLKKPAKEEPDTEKANKKIEEQETNEEIDEQEATENTEDHRTQEEDQEGDHEDGQEGDKEDDHEEELEEDSQPKKKVFRRPGEEEGMTGSNLKMLQQAKVDLAKKEVEIKKMTSELQEVYEKLKNSDELHSTEMEVQKLEFEAIIEQKGIDLEEKNDKIKTLTKRAERAESNQKSVDDISMSKEQLEEIKAKEEKAKTDVEDKEKIIQELQAEIEKYSEDNANKEEEIESLKLDIETLVVEKEIAVEEKQIIEQEMKQQEEDRKKAMEESMTEDELKYQNENLRAAFRKLNNDVEVERAAWEKEKAELEEKVEDVDVLLDAVEERDQEIEEMRETVEEATEFQQIVEELTEELVEKEEYIDELQQRIQEYEEVQAVQEEINEGQIAYENELRDEIEQKDIKIQEMENDIQILEEALLEQDDTEAKHKERINELNTEVNILNEQLNDAYDDQTKNKIKEMMNNQKILSSKLRESARKEIGGSLAEINVGISNTLADLYSSFIPEKLLREGYISNFNKIRLVIYVKNKAYLTYTELCKRKFIEGSDFSYGEGVSQSYEYFKYMCTLGDNCVKCSSLCQNILHALTFMDAESYKTIADSSFWQNFVFANSFLDNMINMIRDDTLTTKVSQDGFQETLEEFENFFNENIKDVVNEVLKLNPADNEEMDICEVPKNVVKEKIQKIGLAILALGFYMRQKSFYEGKEQDMALQERCTQVYSKIIDSILAIDEIEQDDHGTGYFKGNFHLIQRLQDKYEFVQKFWEEDSMAFDELSKQSETTEQTKEGEGEGDEIVTESEDKTPSAGKISYDWYAWLDSVDREHSTIMSEDSMQELKDRTKEENSSPFLKKMSKGPWMELANRINESLSQTDAMKDENEKMIQKIKDQNIAYVKLKKTSDNLEIIKDTLERKIAELELDTQKLTSLNAEKKRLEEKLSFIQGQLTSQEKVTKTLKEKIDKLEEEKNQLKKKAEEAANSVNTRRGDKRRNPIGKIIGRTNSSNNPNKIMDESSMNVMYELQEENAALKRSKLFNRMTKLSKDSISFNKFLNSEEINEDIEPSLFNPVTRSLRLQDEEEAEIHGSINEINGIKSTLRARMCKAKVFKIGDNNEGAISDPKIYLEESIKHKKSTLKSLKKVNAHMKKINEVIFSGHPEGDLGTSFQKYTNADTSTKIEKSADWKVIGRVKIKPPADYSSEKAERVEKVFLNQQSAHKVLRALPILPSSDLLVTLP